MWGSCLAHVGLTWPWELEPKAWRGLGRTVCAAQKWLQAARLEVSRRLICVASWGTLAWSAMVELNEASSSISLSGGCIQR